MNKDNQPTLSIIHQILKDADEENYFLDLLTLSCEDVDAASKEWYLYLQNAIKASFVCRRVTYAV